MKKMITSPKQTAKSEKKEMKSWTPKGKKISTDDGYMRKMK